MVRQENNWGDRKSGAGAPRSKLTLLACGNEGLGDGIASRLGGRSFGGADSSKAVLKRRSPYGDAPGRALTVV